MIGNVVARRYAQALVDVVQKQHGDFEVVGKALQDISELIHSNEELPALLYNPSIHLEFKRKVLDSLTDRFHLPPIVINFLRLLLEKDRLKYLPAIQQRYEELANAAQNRVKVQIRSAFPLSPALSEELRRRLSEYMAKEVIMEVKVDPELLGGIVAQIGSIILDGSVRNQLQQLSAEMTRG